MTVPVILVHSPHPLAPYGQKLDRAARTLGAPCARTASSWPNASRPAPGAPLTYAQTYAAVRAIAAALLERDLSPDRPIAILSGNDIEHALLGLAAMHVGIPYAPISVPYSLQSQDFGKLKAIIGILTPGLVFAANGTAFARAIGTAVPADMEVAVTANPLGDRPTTMFSALMATAANAGGRGGACAASTPTRWRKSSSLPARPPCPRASPTLIA